MVSAKTGHVPNHEIILGMDQNIDLLKSEEHASTRNFFDLILDWFMAGDYKTNEDNTEKCYSLITFTSARIYNTNLTLQL